MVCGWYVVPVPRNHNVARSGQVEPAGATNVHNEIFAVAYGSMAICRRRCLNKDPLLALVLAVFADDLDLRGLNVYL